MLKCHMLESLLPVGAEQMDNAECSSNHSHSNCDSSSTSSFYGHFQMPCEESRSLPGDLGISTISGSSVISDNNGNNMITFTRTLSKRYSRLVF